MQSILSHSSKRIISSSKSNHNTSILPLERCTRHFHPSNPIQATALPITATGPPPSAPVPSASDYGERIRRRRRIAEMLKQGKELRAEEKESKASPLRKRFWKQVHVKDTPEGYQIYLDDRPVRTPSKTILTIPLSKPYLAHAIAIEWDLLVSAAQALKNHNIPMTSMAARAQDVIEAEKRSETKIRNDITTTMMRYLDTDTILCWAPEPSGKAGELEMRGEKGETLREIQVRVARPIISYLNTSVWPGVEIKPVLSDDSIMPVKQSEVTRSIIQGWIMGLPAYELTGLEQAVIAAKSLLIGARLLIEWSEHFRNLQTSEESRFGIEEATEASQVEVKWQTGMWGEVEDTHDVDNEDIRRQLGSAILLVSGNR